MKSGQSKAEANKAIRQEALREQLSAQGHVQQVIVNIKKFEDLANELDNNSIQRLKAANEHRLKLINKYLPDLKATELTGSVEADVRVSAIQIQVINSVNADN